MLSTPTSEHYRARIDHRCLCVGEGGVSVLLRDFKATYVRGLSINTRRICFGAVIQVANFLECEQPDCRLSEVAVAISRRSSVGSLPVQVWKVSGVAELVVLRGL